MKPTPLLVPALFLVSLGALSGCKDGQAPKAAAADPNAPVTEAKFAIVDGQLDRKPFPATLAPEFSGAKAYAHVKALCEIGPRPPQSEGYEKAAKYAEEQFAASGWMTRRESFRAKTPDGEITFTNIHARFRAYTAAWNRSTPVVIAGHFDTKKEKDFVFLGANDSGSSTGVILEMARVLAMNREAASSVEFVLFDGEEALGGGITATDGLYGSKHFAGELKRRATQPNLGVVLDLVGDIRQKFYYNPEAPPYIARKASAAAARLSFDLSEAEGGIIDDHVPLQDAGLKCLHLIGAFTDMPYWHKEGDTMEVISAEALEKTGKVTLTALSDAP